MALERRNLIRWLLSGGFTASILSFIYPVIKFVMPPAIPEAVVNELAAGKVQDLKPHSAKIVKFGSRPVLLIRVNETEWKALSATCSHLNCTVQFQEPRQQIWCACHNGFYDLNGRVVSGPPPRPLEEFIVRLRGDEVIVTKQT